MKVLNGEGRVRFIAPERTLTMQGLKVVATEPGIYDLNVTLTDRDDDVWTMNYSVKAE